MGGIDVFEYGEEVLSHLPSLFQRFVARNEVFDFALALHPLWTALDGVLDNRLALASVALERTASLWEACKAEVLSGPPQRDSSVWKNKPLLKTLRVRLINQLNEFITSDPCRDLREAEKREFCDVLTARINNLTGIPNSARLRKPFEDLLIPLSDEDNDAIVQRNSALHGRREGAVTIENLDRSVEYFDRLRMLITKFVLRLCDYRGPCVDYASRPPAGNFEVKRLADAGRTEDDGSPFSHTARGS